MELKLVLNDKLMNVVTSDSICVTSRLQNVKLFKILLSGRLVDRKWQLWSWSPCPDWSFHVQRSASSGLQCHSPGSGSAQAASAALASVCLYQRSCHQSASVDWWTVNTPASNQPKRRHTENSSWCEQTDRRQSWCSATEPNIQWITEALFTFCAMMLFFPFRFVLVCFSVFIFFS